MDEYYTSQAGSGIPGFSGIRYQRGRGFFSSLFTGGVMPLIRKVLPYLGKRTFETGLDIADDLSKGEKFGPSLRKRFKAAKDRIGTDTITKMKMMAGSGMRRRRRKRSKCQRVFPVNFQFKKKSTKRLKGRKKRRRRSKKKKASDFL